MPCFSKSENRTLGLFTVVSLTQRTTQGFNRNDFSLDAVKFGPGLVWCRISHSIDPMTLDAFSMEVTQHNVLVIWIVSLRIEASVTAEECEP